MDTGPGREILKSPSTYSCSIFGCSLPEPGLYRCLLGSIFEASTLASVLIGTCMPMVSPSKSALNPPTMSGGISMAYPLTSLGLNAIVENLCRVGARLRITCRSLTTFSRVLRACGVLSSTALRACSGVMPMVRNSRIRNGRKVFQAVASGRPISSSPSLGLATMTLVALTSWRRLSMRACRNPPLGLPVPAMTRARPFGGVERSTMPSLKPMTPDTALYISGTSF